jgi:CheY-like chemotaxis protein
MAMTTMTQLLTDPEHADPQHVTDRFRLQARALAASANAIPDEAMAEGVTTYLRKPVGGNELKEALTALE